MWEYLSDMRQGGRMVGNDEYLRYTWNFFILSISPYFGGGKWFNLNFYFILNESIC